MVGVPPTRSAHHESRSSRSRQADGLENRHCTPSNNRKCGGGGTTGPQATPHRTTFRYTLKRPRRVCNNKLAGDHCTQKRAEVTSRAIGMGKGGQRLTAILRVLMMPQAIGVLARVTGIRGSEIKPLYHTM